MRPTLCTPATTGRLLACCLLVTSLSGCVVLPARGGYGYGYGGGGGDDYATVAPPAPQLEVAGVAPVAGWLWLGGYWGWRGGRHEWVGGHWEAPRAGHYWVPHRWASEGGRWRLHSGYWQRRG